MIAPFDLPSESAIMVGIWSTALALIAVSTSTMAVLIVRRMIEARRQRVLAKRRQALTRLVMMYLEWPLEEDAIRAACRTTDVDLILDVSKNLSRDAAPGKQLRADLDMLREIVQDLLGSVRGDSRDRIIGILRQTRAKDVFLAELRKGHVGTRIRAIETLALLPDADVIEALSRALHERSPDVRLAAASALVETGQSITVEDLVDRLEIGVTVRSRTLRDIFRVIASRDTAELVRLLDSRPQDLIAALAIYAIGTTHDYSLISAITRHSDWPSIGVRTEIMRALAAIGHPSAEPTILAGLEDAAWEVRAEAAIGAGRIPLPNAIPSLVERLSDTEWWPRYRAAEALMAMGSQGREVLVEARRGHGRAARIADMILAEEKVAA